MTIIALGRARIRAIGTKLAGKPILDLVDCTRTHVYNLRTHSTPTGKNRPACAIAIGRSSPLGIGGGMLTNVDPYPHTTIAAKMRME